MFKKIWNDSVGSKVIAGGILAALGYILLYLYNWYKSISLIETWKQTKDYVIPIAITVVVLYIVLTIYSRYQYKKMMKLNNEEFSKNFKKMFEDYKQDIIKKRRTSSFWDRDRY
ncbi:hypothetical protein BC952_2591 [Flavobacterium limicola]|uniref:Uncharacterized protein n=1 Tax=Flavobacterium limicola TaxID=180441 RepID=A0A495RYN5_9FLAO|nr:hypothetical protein [Flavobacterium limicola]RKS92677.1 hypothetical protein BC952_2591 [Flavobacterium limicola]